MVRRHVQWTLPYTEYASLVGKQESLKEQDVIRSVIGFVFERRCEIVVFILN